MITRTSWLSSGFSGNTNQPTYANAVRGTSQSGSYKPGTGGSISWNWLLPQAPGQAAGIFSAAGSSKATRGLGFGLFFSFYPVALGHRVWRSRVRGLPNQQTLVSLFSCLFYCPSCLWSILRWMLPTEWSSELHVRAYRAFFFLDRQRCTWTLRWVQ